MTHAMPCDSRRTLSPSPFRCVPLLIFGAIFVGCGDDDALEQRVECYLGDEASCTGQNGCPGTKTCSTDGWAECVCQDTLPNDFTPVQRRLGGTCSSDAECPSEATCLDAASTSWFGGAPPEGICVANCFENAEVCNAFEASVCVDTNQDHAFCLPTCSLTGSLGSARCNEVPFSACDVLSEVSVGYCRPFCMLDSDCSSGHCDRRYGTCVSQPLVTSSVAFGQR
ncbi:MAG TPA: hypothetical protein VIV60_02300, partial [Polyangiaceae bacterium]